MRTIKVPAVVPAGLGGLAAGLAAGVIWLAGFGYKPPGDVGSGSADATAAAPKGGGMPKGGMPKGDGMPKGPPGIGPPPPSPRAQLIALVNALDILVDKPVTLTLTADDRKAIADQLKGLDAAGEVKDDDAKARVDAIRKVVEKDRPALEAVGYQWAPPTGPKGFGDIPPSKEGVMASPNPFKAPQTAQKVRSLVERLGKN